MMLDPAAIVEKAKAKLQQDHKKCLQERVALYLQCEHDEQFRAAVYKRCSESCFYFIYYFGWTYDPREKLENQKVPFLLYPFQRELLTWFRENIDATTGSIERRDLFIEKSRDMGLSWLVYIMAVWYWLFRDGNILVGSNTATDVDKQGDMSTPFEKMRFLIRELPQWILPPGFDLSKDMPEMLIRGKRSGQQIVGKPSTVNFGRGPRVTFAILDEFQSWENAQSAFTSCSQTTNCRIIIGTPLGPHNYYAKLARGEVKQTVIKKRVHWSLHPTKSAGLTRTPEGELTSPWYEEQKKSMAPEEIASELDIKYDTSTAGKVFPDFTESHIVDILRPVEGKRILRVWDPGLTFAVLWMQIDDHNRCLVLRELVLENARIHDVAQTVLQISEEEFKGFDFEDIGDPAGASRLASAQEAPEYTVLSLEYDINVDYYTFSDMQARLRVKSRVTAIHGKLRDFCPTVKPATPALLVSRKNCPFLCEALLEKYRYKVDRLTRRPLDIIDEQHPFEDVVDCLGYGLVHKYGVSGRSKGTGGGSNVVIEKGSVAWRGSGGKRRYGV